jgi:bifunctional non-homologous end joining protein LigD
LIYEDGRLLFAGKVRQGLDPAIRAKLFKVIEPLRTAGCPFANLPIRKRGRFGEGVTAEDMASYVWVRPELEAEVRFTEWTGGGVLRHAEFVAAREHHGNRL